MKAEDLIKDKDLMDALLYQPAGYPVFNEVEKDPDYDKLSPEEKLSYIEVRIPFCGTYESTISNLADNEVEYDLNDQYWLDENREDLFSNKKFIEFLENLDEDDIQQIKEKKTQLEIVFVADLNQFCRDYLEYIQPIIEYQSGYKFKHKLLLKEMVSPREYNFTTDSLWAYMHIDDWYAINPEKVMETEEYKEWASIWYTPVDGYIPFYSKEDYFDPTATLQCSEGILAYYIAKDWIEDENQGFTEEYHELSDVRWHLVDQAYMDDGVQMYLTGLENCDSFYLYKNQDPSRYK